MKLSTLFAASIAFFLVTSMGRGQQQLEYPRGVFTFGNTSVDFQQMKNDLSLTWVQGYGGSGSFHRPIETNPYLKVITIRDNVSLYAGAQHLEIEAENGNTGTQAYFQRLLTPQTGQSYVGNPPVQWCRVLADKNPPDQPGYMASDMWPNSEFHLTQNVISYTATFIMKITKTNAENDPVVLLTVVSVDPNHPGDVLGQKTVYENDFTADGVYQGFEITFGLTTECTPPSSSGAKQLTGSMTMSTVSDCYQIKNVDVRVYWYGTRTTWLDKVILEDNVGYQLFARYGQTAGLVDNLLTGDMTDFQNTNTYSTLKRVYMKDEPHVNQFQTYNYIDHTIKNSLPGLDPTLEGRGRGITATFWDYNWLQWFIRDAQPHEVLEDPYPITANIPYPTSTTAQNDGIVQYNGTNYDAPLQSAWNTFEGKLSATAISGNTWWLVPQLHGIYFISNGLLRGPTDPSGSGSLRPPTGIEIQAQINIANALGAKGYIAYPYGTDFYPAPQYSGDTQGGFGTGLVSNVADPDGIFRNHSSNLATLPYGTSTKTLYVGYQEKWDALKSINQTLQILGPVLINLTWDGAKSWMTGTTYGTWNSLATGVSTANTNGVVDPSSEVLTGHLHDGSNTDYLYVVNRRCDPTNSMDTSDISITLGAQEPCWIVANVQTNQTWQRHQNGSFTDRFAPGEGKLYRLTNGHLLSTTSAALGTNAQHKMVRDFLADYTQTLHMVYESNNQIWYTSYDDDAATWSPETQISSGGPSSTVNRNSSLLLENDGQNVSQVYEAVIPFGTDWSHAVMYNGHTVGGFIGTQQNDAMPVFASTKSHEIGTSLPALPSIIAAIWRNGSKLTFHLGVSTQDESYNRIIFDNTENATNPAMAVAIDKQSFDGSTWVGSYVFHIAWEEAGAIKYMFGKLTRYTSTFPCYDQFVVGYPCVGQINWSVPVTVSGTGANSKPTIAVSPSNDGTNTATIAWECLNGSQGSINVINIPENSSPSAIQSFISTGSQPHCPSLSDFRYGSANNDLTLVWYSSQGTTAAQYMGTKRVWSSPYLIDASGRNACVEWSMNYETNHNLVYVSSLGPPYSLVTEVVPNPPLPPAPTLSSPADGLQTVSPFSLVLSWNSAPGASTYNLELATDNGFTQNLRTFTNIAGTQQTVTNLTYSQTNYWHVQSVNNNGTGPWSASRSFTTQAQLLAPGLLSPANSSTNDSVSSAVVWHSASGATDYNLQVATDVGFNTITTNVTSTIENGTLYTYWYPSLNNSTTYWWHVRSTNGSQTSSWSSAWSFTTVAAPPGGGGGGGGGCCPYIYVQGDTSLNEENNILPQSEASGNAGKDVSDYYKLLKPPTAKNGQYELELKEFEHERSFLDQLQLIAVDHPSTDNIAVSSDGSLIQYRVPFRLADIISGDTTLIYIFSWMDGITYGAGNGKKFMLKVKQNSDAFTTFSNVAHGGVLIGGRVVHGYTGQTACQPKPDKVGSASGGDGFNVIEGSSQPFTFRERPTLVYVPLKELKDTVTIAIGARVQIDYLNLATQIPDNYTSQDLELISAKHSSQGSVYSALTNADGSYATLVPGESIRLQFSAPPLDPALTRSFILVSRGHYEHLTDASAIEKPKTFLLGQNYPNPFNPTTTMDYQLAAPGFVSVVVYNILGEEVARLVQTQQDAGYYSTAWNAVSSPSGIYYVRMTVSDQSGKQLFATTKKLVLMK